LEQLRILGVNLDAVTAQLEKDGVAKFNKSFDQLIAALSKKTASAS
jgi:transaldolase